MHCFGTAVVVMRHINVHEERIGKRSEVGGRGPCECSFTILAFDMTDSRKQSTRYTRKLKEPRFNAGNS